MQNEMSIFTVPKPVLQRRTINGATIVVMVTDSEDHSGLQESYTDKHRCSLCNWGMRHSTAKHQAEVDAFKLMMGEK